MISPLQIPGNFQSQSLDFTPLAQLGTTYKQAAQDRMRQETLASLGNGSLDEAAARRLIASGDMSLASLGVGLSNTNYSRSRDVISDQFRREEAARAQANADRSYSLQVRQADRLDEGPNEKVVQRLKVLESQKIDPTSPEGRAYLLTGNWTGPGANEASLQPVYGTGPDGKPMAVQPTKSGVAIPMRTPDGFSISREPMKVDTGTAIEFYDPQTRQLIKSVPKDLVGAERDKVLGEETGKGQVALPQVLATSAQTLKAIEDVRNHPGRGWGTGALGTVPGIPGTEQKGFVVALDQLKGKTFLEAFNSLRGGGAITEAEGAKATNAMARLDRAQNKQDFEAGLNDLRDVVKAGMLRAAAKARGAGQQQASPAATPPVVVPNDETAAIPAAPRAGELRDGYRFKGGNPADPNSWIKVN